MLEKIVKVLILVFLCLTAVLGTTLDTDEEKGVEVIVPNITEYKETKITKVIAKCYTVTTYHTGYIRDDTFRIYNVLTEIIRKVKDESGKFVTKSITPYTIQMDNLYFNGRKKIDVPRCIQ